MATEHLLRVVGLGRVSTRKRSQETSLDRQRAELAELAARRGWRLVGWFEDRASGGTMLRPGLQAALDLVFSRRADALLVHDIDRLGRDVRDLLATVDALAAQGKGLYIRDWEIDATGAHGRMTFTFFAMFAEYYRRQHGEKVRSGLARAAQRGRRPGRARTIDYARAEQARQLRIEGQSWREIAAQLGGTGGAWSRLLSRIDAAA
jgi:DNA invertase Pin-like site-specific DNA recombinase